MNTTGIKYICPRGNSGYSQAAKEYIISLTQANIPITVQYLIFDETEYQIGSKNNLVNSLVDNKIDYNKVIIHSTPEHWGKIIREEENKEIIGMTVWETDKIDSRWVKWINQVDKVIVPCKWNKEVFEQCGIVKPIEVIPHIYSSQEKFLGKIKHVKKSYFFFYTIGQWSSRKGIEDTLKAYLEAFTSKDKVCLIIKSFGNNYSQKEKELLRTKIKHILTQYSDTSKVILLLDELSEKEISALHNLGHCYVSLHKSEGWGLGMFDALGFGKPVITTGYGGQLDFVKEYLVSYKLIPVEGMSWIPWYNKSQNWAQPNIYEGAKLMRQVYCHYEEAKLLAQQQQRNILDKFNSKVIEDKLINFLNE